MTAATTMRTFPLSAFRWHPTQRRLATEDDTLGNYTQFKIEGKKFTIIFVHQGTMVDPHTKTNKRSWVYKPDPKTTPKEYQDITLYVHMPKWK